LYKYLVKIYEKECPAKKSKGVDNDVSSNCISKSMINVNVLEESLYDKIFGNKSKKESFELGVGTGALVFCVIMFCGCGLCAAWYYVLKDRNAAPEQIEHIKVGMQTRN